MGMGLFVIFPIHPLGARMERLRQRCLSRPRMATGSPPLISLNFNRLSEEFSDSLFYYYDQVGYFKYPIHPIHQTTQANLLDEIYG